jgi:SAM-dependent methyltransferase
MSTNLEAPISPAESLYEQLASAYDLMTAAYDHGRWLDAIERLAREHGLSGRRALDVACGTGKSFLPLLERGYEVTACDVSPAMAAIAHEKAAGRAAVYVADMRELPVYGRFDLITCLDDALNHLSRPEDVLAALAGIRSNLAPSGLAIFDLNTFTAYQGVPESVVEDDERLVLFRGGRLAIERPGAATEVVVELFERVEGDLWRRRTSRQPHRHYPMADVQSLVEQAGLELRAVCGQRPGVRIEPRLDEQRDHKALIVAARRDESSPSTREEV